MKQKIRYHVWDARVTDGHGVPRKGRVSAAVKKEPFRFHCILGNNHIVAPSEGYGSLRDCLKTLDSIWHETAIAQDHKSNYLTRAEFLLAFPVSLTVTSLRMKV
ncbi:MAG: hypothetical protein ABIP06_06510 [Pyrinomonadaceae bacterium]